MTIGCIKEWFALAVPEPTDKNRAVQLGCHFEEVGEMRDALGDELSEHTDFEILAYFFKRRCPGVPYDAPDRKELLDALCDQIVTAVGVGHMFGLDVQGALEEVNRSNWSKFVDGKPVFDENGKIKKGPGYTAPNLGAFV